VGNVRLCDCATVRLCDCAGFSALALIGSRKPEMRRAELTNGTHSIRNIRELPNAVYTALQFTPCFPGGECSPHGSTQQRRSEAILPSRAGRARLALLKSSIHLPGIGTAFDLMPAPCPFPAFYLRPSASRASLTTQAPSLPCSSHTPSPVSQDIRSSSSP
jgi:hypothetical protein